jgi:hypothetical protein
MQLQMSGRVRGQLVAFSEPQPGIVGEAGSHRH